MNINAIIKTLLAVSGILGAGYTFGDKIWASKVEVVEIKTEVKAMHEKVTYMYDAFLDVFPILLINGL